MENCVICGKPGVMFRESGYVCEYHGSMCDRGYDLADIVEEEKNDAEVAAMQAFEKSIGWGEATAPTAAAQGEGLAPLNYDVYQDAPANAMGLVQGVDVPLEGETFHEWVAREGRSVEATAFYWKQIAADNLELGSRGMDDRDAKITALEAALQQAQRERDAALAALERIATASDRVEQVSKVWVYGKPLHEQMQEYAAKVLAASAQQAANAEGGA